MSATKESRESEEEERAEFVDRSWEEEHAMWPVEPANISHTY